MCCWQMFVLKFSTTLCIRAAAFSACQELQSDESKSSPEGQPLRERLQNITTQNASCLLSLRCQLGTALSLGCHPAPPRLPSAEHALPGFQLDGWTLGFGPLSYSDQDRVSTSLAPPRLINLNIISQRLSRDLLYITGHYIWLVAPVLRLESSAWPSKKTSGPDLSLLRAGKPPALPWICSRLISTSVHLRVWFLIWIYYVSVFSWWFLLWFYLLYEITTQALSWRAKIITLTFLVSIFLDLTALLKNVGLWTG